MRRKYTTLPTRSRSSRYPEKNLQDLKLAGGVAIDHRTLGIQLVDGIDVMQSADRIIA